MSNPVDFSANENAKLWKRLMAIIYDLFILTALSLLYGACVTLLSTWLFDNTPSSFQPNTPSSLVFLGWVLFIFGFYCFFWIKVGQTVAMKAWRIKLIPITEPKLSFRACVIRCIFGVMSLACFGLGYLWALVDREKLALHDRISGTRVVQLSKEEA